MTTASIAPTPTAVPAITLEEKWFFDLHGYLILRNVLTPGQCGAMLEAAERLERDRREELEKHDQVRLDGLPQMDPVFDIPIAHPRVLPYLKEFQDRPQLGNTWCITKGPRANISRWHRGFQPIDYSYRNGIIRTRCLNSAWLLTDNQHGDGGLGVLPASHKGNIDIDWASYKDLALPGSIEAIAKAGDVVLFSESLIHIGLTKTTPGHRTNLYYNHAELYAIGANFTDLKNLHIYCFPPRVRERFNKEQLELCAWMEQVTPAIHERAKS